MLSRPIRSSAFTLAELIVVIAILAVLSTIAFLALSGYRQDARDAVIATNARSIYSAISNESAATGQSPRYFIVHDPDYTLSGAIVVFDGTPVPLVGGAWNAPGTNYSAGNPDYANLKLDPEKFKISFLNRVPAFDLLGGGSATAAGVGTANPSYLLVWATDVVDPSGSGKRVRSFVQVAALKESGTATVTGDFPSPEPGASGGLIKDVASDSSSGALIDGAEAGSPAFCEATTASGYSIPWLSSGQSSQVQKDIDHGTASSNALCAFGQISLSSETASCESGFVPETGESGARCVADVCGWPSPGTDVPNAESNAESQSVSGTWHRSQTPGQCTFDCVSGFSWDGSACRADCEIPVSTSHSWAEYVLDSIGVLPHSQTGSRMGTSVFGTAPANGMLTADFEGSCDNGTLSWTASGSSGNCQANYTWNGSWESPSCESNSQTGSCSGLPTNAVWNSASSIPQTWNGSEWAPSSVWSYSETPSTSECRFKCASGYAWNSETSSCQIAFVQISAGSNHACGITSAGGVKCWGYNHYGQLGNGTVTASTMAPTDVTGLASWVTKIVARGDYTCAIHNGAAKCWGYNAYGTLGDGTSTDSPIPLTVTGLSSNVTDITTGFHHSCAIQSGAMKCWGYNYYGGLWNGTTTNSLTPVQVTGLTSGVTKIASNYYASCAIHNGAAKCWGYNAYGGTGNGTTTQSTTPVQVTGLTSGVTDITSGVYASCAVHNGAAKCWGYNYYGGLWNGTTTDSSSPVQVTGLASGIAQISMGHYQACALDTGGNVKCWGYNTTGAVGDGTTTDRYAPVAVSGLPSWVSQISAGGNFSCALSNGIAKCWGYNGWNQLAKGSNNYSLTPVALSQMGSNVGSIAVGNPSACAIQTNGAAKCWGYNYYGSVGDGTNVLRSAPTDVSGLSSNVTNLSVGNHYACAVHNGAAKCWGYNPHGGLWNGTTTNSSTPVQVTGLTSGVTGVSTYLYSSCAVHNGAAKCWGYNGYGGLGNGTVTSNSSPVQVTGLTSGVTKTSVGYYHSCAIHNGAVKCWGYNGYGQLGNSATTDSSSPVQATGLTSGVTDLSLGVYHSCAIHNGAVKCWGYNAFGGVGNGSTAYVTAPTQVTGLTSGYVGVVAGHYHSCALHSSGAVKCWGYGYAWAIGNGSIANQLTPVDVPGISSATQISASTYGSCAKFSDGTAKCWGSSVWGQLGFGGPFVYPTPQIVSF